MTSPLSFSSRLCFKLLKRLLYDCQCLLTHVCLLYTSKVCRWKFFHCLHDFLWQFTWVYLSVKWVITFSPHIQLLFFFLLQLLHWHLLYVKPFLIEYVQHWLLYDKLSSNNNNNNNHHVSVVWACVSELTTCRALVLYNTYVVTFVLTDVDVNSVLFIDQQQLALYAHFSQTMVILTLFDVNVSFVQQCITLNQMRTHWLLYINVILIQSQSVLILNSCISCWKHDMTLFLKCHCISKHFSECCSNCKWRDHAAHYSVCNNDVLIVILNNENNNSVNESEHAAQSKQITLMLSARAIIIYINS